MSSDAVEFYAREALGFPLQDWLALERNPYDRIGTSCRASCRRSSPARSSPAGLTSQGREFAFLSICMVLAVSAFYELIE